jgi:hypothetical protein
MEVDSCVVGNCALDYRKQEPQGLHCWTEPEVDLSAVQVSPDDPRLTETVMDSGADAYDPAETFAIRWIPLP